MLIIYKRELQSYFHTPIGYVFIGTFLALAGGLFYMQILQPLSGELLIFLSQLTVLFMLLSPVLTMRLLCEERQKGTDRLLLTSPVSLFSVVLGKYLAAATVLLLAIALTNVYVGIMALYGTVYTGEWLVGYLGFALQGLSFLALDLLVTCFAKNQVSAAVAAFAANLALWMLDLLSSSAPYAWMANTLNFLSLYQRYQPFVLGQLSFSSLVYFVCFTALCVAATMRALDARRFGGAA